MKFVLTPALESDLHALIHIRIEAMRESLQRLGRFDPARAATRLGDSFEASCTRHVEWNHQRVGFVVVKPLPGELLLDHLYVLPSFQNQALGSAVLALVMQEADHLGLVLRLSALKQSASNRFYQRHGFVATGESEWDIHYARTPTLAPPQTTV